MVMIQITNNKRIQNTIMRKYIRTIKINIQNNTNTRTTKIHRQQKYTDNKNADNKNTQTTNTQELTCRIHETFTAEIHLEAHGGYGM